MNIETKSQLKGKKFKCLRVIKGMSIEDIPLIRESLLKQCKEMNLELIEDDRIFSVKNSTKFVMKPIQHREVIGILDCTKSYMDFNGVRIEFANIEMKGLSTFETKNAVYSIQGLI